VRALCSAPSALLSTLHSTTTRLTSVVSSGAPLTLLFSALSPSLVISCLPPSADAPKKIPLLTHFYDSRIED